MRFIKEVYADAEVDAKCVDGPRTVSISADGKPLVAVPQRDLYKKYGWPAKGKITEALEKHRSDA